MNQRNYRGRAARLSVLTWFGCVLFSTAVGGAENGLTLTNIGQIRALSAPDIARRPHVRLQCTVLDQRLGEYLVIRDETGTLFAETRLTTKVDPQERIELLGTPVLDGARVYLENTTFRSVASNAPAVKQAPALPAKPAELPVLTKAWQVRDLSPEAAAWSYPVRVRGVVTYYVRNRRLTVQDDVSGIHVDTSSVKSPELKVGDLVEVEGVSDPGGYAPVVSASRISVVGSSPLPDPRQVTVYQLASSQEGSQWVEVYGVAQSVSYTNGEVRIVLNDPTGRLPVNVLADHEPTNLLDAVIRVRGVCASTSNNRRQFTGPNLLSPSLNFVQIEEPGIADPLSLPVRPVVSLSQFRPRLTLARRVNISGVVTFCQSDHSFFLQDANDGIQVLTSQKGDVKPGDRVMAAGYPTLGDYGSVLRDAVFRVSEHGPVPKPQPLAQGQSLDPRLDGRLVQADARFVNCNRIGRMEVLTLQLGDRVFEARCDAPAADKKAPAANSLLRLTGVYDVLADEARAPVSFQLLVPSAEYIQVLERPPLWTLQRLGIVLAALIFIAAAAMLWVFLLHRQVRDRTRQLRERLEHEAALEKRYQGIVERASEFIFTHDLQGRLTTLNPAGLRALGYTAEEVGGLTTYGLIVPEDQDRARQMQETALAKGEVAPYELELVTKAGQRRKVEVSKHIAYKDGQPVGIQCIARDITERKRIEKRYKAIIGTAMDGFWLADMQGRFLDVNDAYCDLIGYSREEMLRISIPDIEAAEKPEVTAARIRNIIDVGGDRFETQHRCKDGRIVDIEVSVKYLKEDERMAVFLRDITERKHAEAALRESQALYHSLVEHLPVNVYRKDAEGRFTFVNSRFCQFQGGPAEQILGKTLFDLIPKDLAEQFTKEDQSVMQTGKAIEHEEERHDLGEQVQYLHVVKSPVLNSKGTIIGIQGMFYDITARKRAEAALAETSTLLETLLENSPDHIYFKDRQSRFVRCSKAFEELFRVSDLRLLIGKTDSDFFTEEHARPAYEDEQEIIRTGKPIIGKLEKETHPDGRVTWALTTKMPWYDRDGEIIGTFGVSKDVTAIKEAEDKLASERELLRTLLDNVPECIYFKDRESRFVHVSRSKAVKTLARAPKLQARFSQGGGSTGQPTSATEADLLVGLTDFDMFTDEHARPAYEDEQEIIRTGMPIIGKPEKETHPDGSVTWSLTTKLPWRDKDGNVIGTFGISKDITAIKQAEGDLENAHKRLVEASRVAGMAEVATDVLHNVGNVLNSVNVSCSLAIDHMRQWDFSNLAKIPQLLQQNTGRLEAFLTSDPAGKHIPDYLAAAAQNLRDQQSFLLAELEQLRKHIDHIKQIVAMQQSYAKVAGVEETVEVGQLVEDALHINAAALDRHAVKIRRQIEPVPPILVDKHKTLQILVNLIRNAKYAVSDTGRPDGLLTVRVGQNGGDHVQIQVSDNGVGIAQENLTRIFAHGFTTRGDGHGFGLHSSALAARDLGGTLTARSDGAGKGATFTLMLPLKPLPTRHE